MTSSIRATPMTAATTAAAIVAGPHETPACAGTTTIATATIRPSRGIALV
jgi:hypothetical protein